MDSLVDEVDSLLVPDLSEDLQDWCPNCQQLRQEVKRVQDDFGKLKQKIISTDLLIKKYKSKCEDYDLQYRRTEEAVKRADKYQRQSEILETQLKAALLDTEPLRKTKATLEVELRLKSTEAQSLSDKLVAAEGAQRQYEHLAKASSADIDRLETEKKELLHKIKLLESGKVSKVEAKEYKSEIISLKKENAALSKNAKLMEKKLKAALAKTEHLMDSLRGRKVSPNGRQRGFMSPLRSPVRSPRGHKLSPQVRSRTTSEKESPVKKEILFAKPASGLPDSSSSDSADDDSESLCSVAWTFSPMVKCLSPLPPSPAFLGHKHGGGTLSVATESDGESLSDMADELEQQLLGEDHMAGIEVKETEKLCNSGDIANKPTDEMALKNNPGDITNEPTEELALENSLFDIDNMEDPENDVAKFSNTSKLCNESVNINNIGINSKSLFESENDKSDNNNTSANINNNGNRSKSLLEIENDKSDSIKANHAVDCTDEVKDNDIKMSAIVPSDTIKSEKINKDISETVSDKHNASQPIVVSNAPLDKPFNNTEGASELTLKEKLAASVEIVSPKAVKKRTAHAAKSTEKPDNIVHGVNVESKHSEVEVIRTTQSNEIKDKQKSPRSKNIKSDESPKQISMMKSLTGETSEDFTEFVVGNNGEQRIGKKKQRREPLVRNNTEEFVPMLSDKEESFLESKCETNTTISPSNNFPNSNPGTSKNENDSLNENKSVFQVTSKSTFSDDVKKSLQDTSLRGISVEFKTDETKQEPMVEVSGHSVKSKRRAKQGTSTSGVDSESAEDDSKTMNNEVDMTIEEQSEPVEIKVPPTRSFLRRQQALSGKENELYTLEDIRNKQNVGQSVFASEEKKVIFEKSKSFSGVNASITKPKFDTSKFIAFQKSSSSTLAEEIESLRDVNDYEVLSRDARNNETQIGAHSAKKLRRKKKKMRENCKYKDRDLEEEKISTRQTRSRIKNSESETAESCIGETTNDLVKHTLKENETSHIKSPESTDSMVERKSKHGQNETKEINKNSSEEKAVTGPRTRSKRLSSESEPSDSPSVKRRLRSQRKSVNEESSFEVEQTDEKDGNGEKQEVSENLDKDDSAINILNEASQADDDKKSETISDTLKDINENKGSNTIDGKPKAGMRELGLATDEKMSSGGEKQQPSRQVSTGFVIQTSASFERICSESPVSPFLSEKFVYDKNISKTCDTIFEENEEYIEKGDNGNKCLEKTSEILREGDSFSDNIAKKKDSLVAEKVDKETERGDGDTICDIKTKEIYKKQEITEHPETMGVKMDDVELSVKVKSEKSKKVETLHAQTKEITHKLNSDSVFNEDEINKPGCSYNHQDHLNANKSSSLSLSQEIENITMKQIAPVATVTKLITCAPDMLDNETPSLSQSMSRSTTPSIERTSPLSPLSISPFEFIIPISPLPPSPDRSIRRVSPLSPDHLDDESEEMINTEDVVDTAKVVHTEEMVHTEEIVEHDKMNTKEVVTDPDIEINLEDIKEEKIACLPGTPKSGSSASDNLTFSPLPAMLSPLKSPKGNRIIKPLTGGINSAFKQVTKPQVRQISNNARNSETVVENLKADFFSNAGVKSGEPKNRITKKTSVKLVPETTNGGLTVKPKSASRRKSLDAKRTTADNKSAIETLLISQQGENASTARKVERKITGIKTGVEVINGKGDNSSDLTPAITTVSQLQELGKSHCEQGAGIGDKGDSSNPVLEDLPSGRDNLLATKKKTRMAHKPNMHPLKPQKVQLIEAPVLPPVTVGRKRKSLDVADKDGQEKKPFKENMFQKRKGETSKVTKDETKQMQAFLKSSESAENFVAKVTTDGKAEDIAYKLVDACIECLSRVKTDSLDVVYKSCDTGGYKSLNVEWPFMNDAEKQAVRLVQQLLYLKLPCFKMMLKLWENIFSKDLATNMLGKMSLCRLFTALCLVQRDVERARVLFYHIATCGYLNHWLFVVPVVSVWPEVLKRDENNQPDMILSNGMVLVLEEIITKVLASQDTDTSRKTIVILQKLCNWTGTHGNSDSILKVLLNKLMVSTDEDSTDTSSVFGLCKAIQLLSVTEGWSWFKEQFITRYGLQTAANRYTAKKIIKPVTPAFMCSILRITGSVVGSLSASVNWKDFKKVVQNWLIPVLLKKPVNPEVGECCLEIMIELTALHPALLTNIQSSLTSYEGTVALSKRRLLDEMRQQYLEKFGQVCAPFILKK